jgi:hypothetical protein
MSNLKLGCPSRSQEKWTPEKWDFFKVCPFKWRGLKIKNMKWTFELHFFKKLLISRIWDRQPIVKFHRQHYAIDIYCLIPRNKDVYVACDRERSERPPKSDQLEWYQKWQVIRGNLVFLVSVGR